MARFATVYGKPLVRGLDASPEQALKRVKFSVLARVRQKLFHANFSDRAKRAFARSIQVDQGASSLTISSSHPGFINMIRGRKQAQMKWLVKADRPIPIVTEDGELIFRSATIRSMQDGKWIHPGRGPYDFVEKAKEEAKEQIKSAMMREMMRAASQAFSTGSTAAQRILDQAHSSPSRSPARRTALREVKRVAKNKRDA